MSNAWADSTTHRKEEGKWSNSDGCKQRVEGIEEGDTESIFHSDDVLAHEETVDALEDSVGWVDEHSNCRV